MSVAVLALESSASECTVALLRGALVFERRSEGAVHSEVILPMVSEVLAEAGIGLADVEAIGFGAGPGGFTGVRLACGVAQGLAFGSGKPVVPVDSLEALALASGRNRVLACADARMGEVYHSLCEVGDWGVRTIRGPGVCAPEEVPPPDSSGWHGCGSGFAAYPDRFGSRLLAALDSVDARASSVAAAVARIAARRVSSGGGVDAALALPRYVRDKVALTTAERLARGGRA